MIKYEMGTTSEEDIIYFNMKGEYDKRFSHFHLHKKDAEQLYKDLELLLKLKDKGAKQFNIYYNMKEE